MIKNNNICLKKLIYIKKEGSAHFYLFGKFEDSAFIEIYVLSVCLRLFFGPVGVLLEGNIFSVVVEVGRLYVADLMWFFGGSVFLNGFEMSFEKFIGTEVFASQKLVQ